MSAPDLHVVEAGEGPPIVLLHGLTATHRYVVHGSRALERGGYRVVAYDARGHGASPPAEGYDYPSLAQDLLALLDARGIERAVLAGASMGGHTALRVALDEPDRVAGLAVITPAWSEDRDADLAQWDRLAAALRSDGVDGFVDAYDYGRIPSAFRGTVEKVLRQRMAAHDHLDAVADALQQVPRSDPYASIDALAGLTQCPVLIVGSRDAADPGHPLAVAERYAETIPGAQLVVEDEGESPIAWRGGTLSQRIAALAAEAAW